MRWKKTAPEKWNRRYKWMVLSTCLWSVQRQWRYRENLMLKTVEYVRFCVRLFMCWCWWWVCVCMCMYVSARFDSPKFIQPKHFHLKRQASVFPNEKVCVAMRLVSFVLNRRAHTHNLYWNRTKNKGQKKAKNRRKEEREKYFPKLLTTSRKWSNIHSHCDLRFALICMIFISFIMRIAFLSFTFFFGTHYIFPAHSLSLSLNHSPGSPPCVHCCVPLQRDLNKLNTFRRLQ